MTLPTPETPLYNHPLPDIEIWLTEQGCQQDPSALNRWTIQRPAWEAVIILEIDSILVIYIGTGEEEQDIQRSFKYSLSRQDLTDAIFSGP
jgi:hypothetical protein